MLFQDMFLDLNVGYVRTKPVEKFDCFSRRPHLSAKLDFVIQHSCH